MMSARIFRLSAAVVLAGGALAAALSGTGQAAPDPGRSTPERAATPFDDIPGMGRLLVQSVTRRDFPIVQAAVLVVAVIEVLVMLLIDILYVFIDPRIRYVGD